MGFCHMQGVVPESAKATFRDVKGCDDARNELQEVVEYLRTPGVIGDLDPCRCNWNRSCIMSKSRRSVPMASLGVRTCHCAMQNASSV